jgi:hypothetical protein
MSIANESAFPGGVNQNYTDRGQGEPTQYGLTKLEYFAGLAMQGIMGNSCALPETDQHFKNIAQDAVFTARALIAELEKP